MSRFIFKVHEDHVAWYGVDAETVEEARQEVEWHGQRAELLDRELFDFEITDWYEDA